MLIDMHFHVEKKYHNPDHIDLTIEDAEKHKMLIAANSCDIKGYEETLSISKRTQYIIPGFGILPWYAHNYYDKLDSVKLPLDEVGMLGEIGIDYRNSPPEATKPMQKALFGFFLSAAEKHDLIVNIHVRGDDTMVDAREMMSSYNLSRVIMHSYYDTPTGMKELADRGYYFTIGQAVLEPGDWKERIHNAINEIPDENLLVETDCAPRDYVPPSTILKRIHDELANFRGKPVSELRDIIRQNSVRLMKGVPQLKSFVKLIE
jgi:TatD DNase family protein